MAASWEAALAAPRPRQCSVNVRPAEMHWHGTFSRIFPTQDVEMFGLFSKSSQPTRATELTCIAFGKLHLWLQLRLVPSGNQSGCLNDLQYLQERVACM